MLITSLGVLAACGDEEPAPAPTPAGPTTPGGDTHTHTLASGWEKDASTHWHKCTSCTDKVDLAAHAFEIDEDDVVACTVCGYECSHENAKNEVVYDASYHWLAEVCPDCEIATPIGVKQPHSYVTSDDCSCGRNKNEPDHDEHTYEEEWTRLDSVYHWKAPTCASANGVECKTVPDYIEDAEREEHVDGDGDELCDICGGSVVNVYDIEAKYSQYNWPITELIVCLNENSNNQELSSELRRYLAGDLGKNADGSAILPVENVDKLVAARNAAALAATKVTVKYVYWGEGDTGYSNDSEKAWWGQTVTRMTESATSGGDNAPDIFVNQIYDMVAAQLKGAFLNTRSEISGNGVNHFTYTDKEFVEYVELMRPELGDDAEFGYMMEYMSELGFSVKKQYLVASDYFIDLARAFFVMPLNISLLKGIGLESAWSNGVTDPDDPNYVNPDRNGNTAFDVDDFYDMVMNGEWTYEVLMHYSQAAHQPTSGVVGGSIEDTNGLILTSSNGMIPSALLYTTSIKIFDRKLDDNGMYTCTYPAENEELFLFCDMLTAMVSSKGVVVDDVSHLVVRDKFVANKVLFGGIILLGSLEYKDYQDMKSGDGFGVLPVPLYQRYKTVYDKDGKPVLGEDGKPLKEQDNYLTIIHNMGRIGAISVKAKAKFVQCTAFLDYQSTHSSDILDEYYKYKLQYDAAGGSAGNIKILEYIRENVRSAFDKTYEDAIGYDMKTTTKEENGSWAGILSKYSYKCTSMRGEYSANAAARKAYLDEIVKVYFDDTALLP